MVKKKTYNILTYDGTRERKNPKQIIHAIASYIRVLYENYKITFHIYKQFF